jgi:RNA polymerase sigma factor (TIGR02999 family)
MGPEASRTEWPGEPRDVRGESLDRLVTQLHDELRRIAHRHLARNALGTLDTTALVHEAYLKLAGQSRAAWTDRGHFLALAAVAMRHILADRAKARVAKKRGSSPQRITLDEELIGPEDQAEALLQLEEALDRVAGLSPRLAQVVECRFFGGLSNEEIAEALGVTSRTVERDWAKARMLLRRALAT